MQPLKGVAYFAEMTVPYESSRTPIRRQGISMTASGIKNILFIALIALCPKAFGQLNSFIGQSSFVIECDVSGKFIGSGNSPEEKIPNQKITVSVDFFSPEIFINIEGRNRANVGSTRDKPIILTDGLILLVTTVKSPFSDSLRSISINRVTGFIDVFVNVSSPKTMEQTVFTGFCQKASNKKKF